MRREKQLLRRPCGERKSSISKLNTSIILTRLYEADIVGLVLSANEPYSIFSPCITSLVNREVIGIISGIDKPDANVERVARWLRLAGCKKIFPVSAITGEGLADIIAYLEEDDKKPSEPAPVQNKKTSKKKKESNAK